MPWLKWLPWRFLIRRVALAHGFLDPMTVLARLHRFGQPSEVTEPVELLRSGVVFHARGLINSRIIQHNLDWVWPYWVERQFDPADDAFVPRAFSITHINLTHRNWTSIGWPGCDSLPIVDPRGLLTPRFDGWSLDGWIVLDDGRRLLPSQAVTATQRLDLKDEPVVVTEVEGEAMSLLSRAHVVQAEGQLECRLDLEGTADAPGWLVLALRPYNPEGISFVHEVALSDDRQEWTIDRTEKVSFSAPADRHHLSEYHAGDVLLGLGEGDGQMRGECELGLATAAAMFRLAPGSSRRIGARFALKDHAAGAGLGTRHSWHEALEGACQLDVSDTKVRQLYDTALHVLVLHSPGDVYPGPYTYKRFWFRDAAFIVHALICAGLTGRAGRALDRFAPRQTARGYFHSQEGEWDSNGEALWIFERFCRVTARAPKPAWQRAAVRGADWIVRKRAPDDGSSLHAGLLPAGFSAEHLGPNDYYYWDNFWGVAGLEAAAALCRRAGDKRHGHEFAAKAESYRAAIDANLERVRERLGRPAMAASPYRRLDAGAIGSIAAGYPLQLFSPQDPRLTDTADYLMERNFVDGGFFQDMIHSGINPYLTLHVAQVLLRAGDPRFAALRDTVARLASPTGQWPEAIHPRTGGGCMGDGQHVWAAAEWVLMIRNCFLREEGDSLVLAGGVTSDWLAGGRTARLGPAPTSFGPVTVEVTVEAPNSGTASAQGHAVVRWHADWHTPPGRVEIRLPGHRPATVGPETTTVRVASAGTP